VLFAGGAHDSRKRSGVKVKEVAVAIFGSVDYPLRSAHCVIESS